MSFQHQRPGQDLYDAAYRGDLEEVKRLLPTHIQSINEKYVCIMTMEEERGIF
jgi:hypothetical protein